VASWGPAILHVERDVMRATRLERKRFAVAAAWASDATLAANPGSATSP